MGSGSLLPIIAANNHFVILYKIMPVTSGAESHINLHFVPFKKFLATAGFNNHISTHRFHGRDGGIPLWGRHNTGSSALYFPMHSFIHYYLFNDRTLCLS